MPFSDRRYPKSAVRPKVPTNRREGKLFLLGLVFLIIFLNAILLPFNSNAKETPGCYTALQLVKWQQTPIEQLAAELKKEGWAKTKEPKDLTVAYFEYALGFSLEHWQKTSRGESAANLVVGYKVGEQHLLIVPVADNCYESLTASNALPAAESGKSADGVSYAGIVVEGRKFEGQAPGGWPTVILVYHFPSVKRLIAIEKSIQELMPDQPIATNSLYKPAEADSLRIKGDSYFGQGKYPEALRLYYKALEKDHLNRDLHEKVLETEKIIRILPLQSADQAYSFILPTEYTRYRDANFALLNQLVDASRAGGSIQYTSNIRFDRDGRNLSQLTIRRHNDARFRKELEGLPLASLPPATIQGFKIPVSEDLPINLTWHTRLVKAKVMDKKLLMEDAGGNDRAFYDKMKSFVSKYSWLDGNYSFAVTDKKLNGRDFRDIRFQSYKYTGGAGNFVYSMILPGLGTRKVSNEGKGNGRMFIFLGAAAASFVANFYSNQQYERYKNSADPDRKVSYYEKAGNTHKASLVAAGFAATVYLYDVFSVVARGLGNSHKNSKVSSPLKQGPIQIADAPLKP